MDIAVQPTTRERAHMRPYRADDIPIMVEYIAVYLPKMPNYQYVKIDRKRLAAQLSQNITNSTYCVLLLEDADGVFGGISGMIYPMPFSSDIFAQDQFLFIDPAKRTLFNANMLIDGFVSWARARGARIIEGSQTSGIKPEAFAVLMHRRGFREVGRLYHLVIE